MKVCKHCKSSDDLVTTKNGIIWSICYTCKREQTSKQHKGRIKSDKERENISKRQMGRPLTYKTKLILREINLGKKLSEDHKLKIGEGNKGKVLTQLTKDKISKSNMGKSHSEQTKQLLSIQRKGKILSDEHKYLISQSLQGRKVSDKTKQLIGDANRGKKRSKIDCIKMSESHKFCLNDYYKKYPFMEQLCELREIFINNKFIIQVKCKKCDMWYTSSHNNISSRIKSLINGSDGCHFYCSDECKNSCSIYRLNPQNFLNNLNNIERKDNSGISTWRIEVLNRQLIELNISTNHCEKCDSEVNLHVHHEKPQKTHPHLALDPDNGIILCSDCHYKYGHSGECSTGVLAAKICG